jgi:hypothetical protein
MPTTKLVFSGFSPDDLVDLTVVFRQPRSVLNGGATITVDPQITSIESSMFVATIVLNSIPARTVSFASSFDNNLNLATFSQTGVTFEAGQSLEITFNIPFVTHIDVSVKETMTDAILSHSFPFAFPAARTVPGHLYPTASFDAISQQVLLTLPKLPGMSGTDWVYEIQSSTPGVKILSVDATSWSGSTTSYGSAGQAYFRHASMFTGIVLTLKFEQSPEWTALTTLPEFRVALAVSPVGAVPMLPFGLTEAVGINQALSVDTTSLHALYIAAPQIELVKITAISPNNAKFAESGLDTAAWFRWELKVMLIQNVQVLQFLPSLEVPKETFFWYCEPDASVNSGTTITMLDGADPYGARIASVAPDQFRPFSIYCYGTVSPYVGDNISGKSATSTSSWTSLVVQHPFITRFRLGSANSPVIPDEGLDAVLPAPTALPRTTVALALVATFIESDKLMAKYKVDIVQNGYTYSPMIGFQHSTTARIAVNELLPVDDGVNSVYTLSWMRVLGGYASPHSLDDPAAIESLTSAEANLVTVKTGPKVLFPAPRLNYQASFYMTEEFSTPLNIGILNDKDHPVTSSINPPIVQKGYSSNPVAASMTGSVALEVTPSSPTLSAPITTITASTTEPTTNSPVQGVVTARSVFRFRLTSLWGSPEDYCMLQLASPSATGGPITFGGPAKWLIQPGMSMPGPLPAEVTNYDSKYYWRAECFSAAGQKSGDFYSALFSIKQACTYPPTYANWKESNLWASTCVAPDVCQSLGNGSIESRCSGVEIGVYQAPTRSFTVNVMPVAGAKTNWYRAAFLVTATSQSYNANLVQWFTVSYTTAAGKAVSGVLSFPDSATGVTLSIPPLPPFASMQLFFINVSTGYVSDRGILLYNFNSVCSQHPDQCAHCTTDQSDYTLSGCIADLESTALGKCDNLVCPRPLSKDLTTCSCTCSDATCLANTRVGMLYSDPLSQSNQEKLKDSSKDYISRTIQQEFVSILQLNSHPPSSDPNYRFLDYSDTSISASAPPVAIETVTVLPITYPTLSTAQLIVFLSFSDLFPGANPTSVQKRFDYLQTKVATVLASLASTNPRTIVPLALSSQTINDKPYTFRFDPITHPLTTQCVNPTDLNKTTLSCPTTTQLHSPFWSACPTASTAADKRSLTLRCVDYSGLTYGRAGADAPWCQPNAFFPGFPKQTSVQACGSTAVYALPIIREFTVLTRGQMSAGSMMDVAWVYSTDVTNPDPTSTVDIFIQKLQLPPFILLDEEENTPNMMTPQQSLASGYRILLGTFPTSVTTASVRVPQNLLTTADSVQVQVSIRVTQNALKFTSAEDPVTVLSADTCVDMMQSCIAADANSTCQAGQCVCKPGHSLNGASGKCELDCAGKCQNDGVCAAKGCTCPSSNKFTGNFCQIDTSCAKENKELCSGHGYVAFASGKCGTTCTCSNDNWFNKNSCTDCGLLKEPSKCNLTGIDPERTTRHGCDQCVCKHGYAGPTCAQRVVYGTVRFTPLTSGFLLLADPVTVTPLSFDDDVQTVLIRDIAQSLNIPESTVTIQQAISTTTSPSAFTTAAVPTTTNAVTFAIQSDDNTQLSDLYNLWNNVQDPNKFPNTPIAGTDTKPVVGTPIAADPAYDPQCNSATTTNCPTGANPLIDDEEEPENPFAPIDSGSPSTSATVVAIVVPIVIVVCLFVAVIVTVTCMKKHQKGCFAPKGKKRKSQTEDHLELGSGSSGKHSTRGGSQTAASQQAPSAYSSGTSTSVDLIAVPLAEDEPELPAGWAKMKHITTGAIIFVNNDDMISQTVHPSKAGGVKTQSGW